MMSEKESFEDHYVHHPPKYRFKLLQKLLTNMLIFTICCILDLKNLTKFLTSYKLQQLGAVMNECFELGHAETVPQ